MKYDSGMTQFHKDIIAVLRYMLKDDKEITEKFSPGDGSPAPLRDYLKLNYGKPCSSHIGDGMRYSCNFSKGLELAFNPIISNSDYKYLTLSWSQVAKFIRDNWDEVFKQEAEEIPLSPQLSYIDKLREKYPKINETDDWFDGYYCPSELFDGDGVNDSLDEKCDYPDNENEVCQKCWRERCPADAAPLTDPDFEKEYFENYPKEDVPKNIPEEKAATKTGSEWELTHLCNKFGEDPCEYFLQTDNEKTVLNGKTLDICSYYCTSENKVRKIGSGGTWTGLSPKFCPKRRTAENKSICDDCINNDENCIKPSEDKCVGYTSESDTILNPAPESKPTYKDIFLEHYPNFDVSRFDEFINSNCRYACAAEYFTDTEPFDCNNPQNCKKCWYSPCESDWYQPDFVLEEIEEVSGYLKTVTIPENESPEGTFETAVAVQDENTEVQTAFDYSELDGNTAKNLRECETVIRQETAGYFTLLGAKFKEAQSLLADHASGTFEKWYTAMGFKRQTVYNLIQRYDFFGSPKIGGREDTFEALPLTLSYEVSKPDAPTELVEKVLDGDITTNAEYIALKKQLEKANEQISILHSAIEKKDGEIDGARGCIETLEKEIDELESRPADVAAQDNSDLIGELEELREENERLKNGDVKSFVIRLTLDEFDKLLAKVDGDPCLENIIKQAKLLKS